LIVAAHLYDLQASRVAASGSFLQGEIDQKLVKAVVDRYYELVQSESVRGFISFSIGSQGVALCPTGENTVLIGISDSQSITPDDLGKMRMLEAAFRRRASESSPREARGSFPKLVDTCLRRNVSIYFVSPESPPTENRVGLTVVTLTQRLAMPDRFLRPVSIGPFVVSVRRIEEKEVPAANWSSDLKEADGLAIVVGPPLASREAFGKLLERIKRNSSVPITVVPGSQEQLELARQFQAQFGVSICSCPADKPSRLLLSLLQAFGVIAMEPDIASHTWLVDESIDEGPARSLPRARGLGHQAFFVIDKRTSKPVFTHYYEPSSKVLERAPNIVAAISMFDLDSTSPNRTSVFQTGELKYAIIERENLIFTLVTGDKEDVESIRSRFSFLPDLYFDEAPKQGTDPNDYYAAPAFTIKLLATLPPEHLGSRMAPYRVLEPDWSRFQDASVRDFLKAVWDTLDGKKTMSQLAGKGGPVMVLGAVHLLKIMRSIKTKPVLASRDVPRLLTKPEEDLYGLYSHLDEIVKLIDGKRSIEEIGRETGIATSVLLTVFSHLHQRWIVGFENDIAR